jgi:hypothetical protein
MKTKTTAQAAFFPFRVGFAIPFLILEPSFREGSDDVQLSLR